MSIKRLLALLHGAPVGVPEGELLGEVGEDLPKVLLGATAPRSCSEVAADMEEVVATEPLFLSEPEASPEPQGAC